MDVMEVAGMLCIKMETKTKYIGSGAIGASIIALILILNYIPTDNTYYCQNEPEKLRECVSLSSGLHTRCYLTKEKDSWDYCKSGWLKVSDYIEIVKPKPKPITISEDVEYYVQDSCLFAVIEGKLNVISCDKGQDFYVTPAGNIKEIDDFNIKKEIENKVNKVITKPKIISVFKEIKITK